MLAAERSSSSLACAIREQECTTLFLAQVVAKGEHGEEAANMIARQCALLRGAHPVLALPSCTGPMATDGTMTDWGIRTVRSRCFALSFLYPAARACAARMPPCHTGVHKTEPGVSLELPE
jgi:hypothetical protein